VREFDLIIRNGTVIDGTGRPGFAGDVAVSDGVIRHVGALPDDSHAPRELDAAALVVSPGFIDIHTHADISLQAHPEHLPKIMQGVTTEIFTNCGLGFAPVTDDGMRIQREYLGGLFGPDEGVDWAWRSVAQFLARFERRGTAANLGYLIPHGAVKVSVMGMDARPATGAEKDAMVAMVRQGMEEGAWGLSTGLWYAPMRSADRDETVRLCSEAGFFATHQRDYEDELFAATEESLAIADEAGVPVQIAHLQFNGEINRGRAPELLSRLDRARESGTDVTWDSYPYLAGSTLVQAMLPEWATAGGPGAILDRLHQPEDRARILEALANCGRGWDRTRLSGAQSSVNRPFEGESFDRIAAVRGLTVPEFICALIEEDHLQACFVYHNAHESDLRAALRHPAQMVGSDGIHIPGKCHPRLYGTFPRVLGRYARDEKTLSLEEAVRKMTAAPAGRIGLADRGLLAPGKAADIVIFNPAEVTDTATYEDPLQFPRGIPYVFVNGISVKWAGEPTHTLPGRVLRRPSP